MEMIVQKERCMERFDVSHTNSWIPFLVMHLLDISILEKSRLSKYFQYFGENHCFYVMKENPYIRRELLVGKKGVHRKIVRMTL